MRRHLDAVGRDGTRQTAPDGARRRPRGAGRGRWVGGVAAAVLLSGCGAAPLALSTAGSGDAAGSSSAHIAEPVGGIRGVGTHGGGVQAALYRVRVLSAPEVADVSTVTTTSTESEPADGSAATVTVTSTEPGADDLTTVTTTLTAPETDAQTTVTSTSTGPATHASTTLTSVATIPEPVTTTTTATTAETTETAETTTSRQTVPATVPTGPADSGGIGVLGASSGIPMPVITKAATTMTTQSVSSALAFTGVPTVVIASVALLLLGVGLLVLRLPRSVRGAPRRH